MTKDEAKEAIKEAYGNSEYTDEIIKALEQVSTTKNDLGVDCVSRKEVEKLVYRFLQKGSDENIAFYEHFLDLPSVTPIRPKGHWCPQNDDYFDWYECSECGYGSEGEMQYSSEVDVRTNYCPNCGADMREVEE